MKQIEIATSNGIRTINISHFPALDGWEIQHRFLTFAASADADVRRAYIMDVLGYAAVVIDGSDPMKFQTAAIINNHLESWQNIEAVFEEVLMYNGIDPKTHADKPRFWADAGAEMATSFLAVVTDVLGPAFAQLSAKQE